MATEVKRRRRRAVLHMWLLYALTLTKHDIDDGGNDDDAKRAGQPKKVGEYGVRGVRAATAPSDSDDDPDSSVNKATTPRATDKADEAPRDGA